MLISVCETTTYFKQMGVLSINTYTYMYRYLSKNVNYYYKVVKTLLLSLYIQELAVCSFRNWCITPFGMMLEYQMCLVSHFAYLAVLIAEVVKCDTLHTCSTQGTCAI